MANGEVVPMPTLVAALVWIEVETAVEVAHLEFAVPPVPPQPVQLPTVRVPIVAVFENSWVVEARPET